MSRLYISGNAVDQNQIPVVGAQVFVFAGGVLTTLEDVDGNALANPLITGADGFYEGYSANDAQHVLEFYWGGRLRYREAVSEIDRIEGIADAALSAADVAQAMANFRATFAEAIADFALGAYFSSAASGTVRVYKRTAGAPGYTDQGDAAAPLGVGLFNDKLEQRVEGGAGTGTSVAEMGAPALLLDVPQRSNRFFGIAPGIDASARMRDLEDWIRERPLNSRRAIEFEPGRYEIDRAHFLLETQPGAERGSLELIGRGGGRSVEFRMLDPDQQVAVTFECASVVGLEAKNIFVWGTGVNQAAFSLLPKSSPFTGSNAGDASMVRLQGLQTWNCGGTSFIRGTQMNGGVNILGNAMPAQHLFLDDCHIIHRSLITHRPVFVALGQFGQVNFINGSFDGHSRENHRGPVMGIGVDWRYVIQPAVSDTGGGFFEVASTVEIPAPSMTPVRVVGTDLPTCTPALSKGTTYFIAKQHFPGGVGGEVLNRRFRLAVSGEQAALGNFLAVNTAGTPANFAFVQLWATALVDGTFTTPRPHMLVTGDEISVHGSAFPAPLAAATAYYVVRVDHTRFRLATTIENALAGTTISPAGGTLTEFGFAVGTGLISSIGRKSPPYSIKASNLTLQSAEMGIHLAGVGGINADVHLEQLEIGVHGQLGTQATISGEAGNKGGWRGDGLGTMVMATGARTNMRLENPVYLDFDVERLGVASASATLDLSDASHSAASSATARSSRTTKQIVVDATGFIDVGAARNVFIGTSATAINSIRHRLAGGARLTIKAHTGPITFSTGGNITLGGRSSLTVQADETVEFALHDWAGEWMLLGVLSSPAETMFNTSVAADGSINIGNNRTILLNPPNANELRTITSTLPAGARITVITHFNASAPRFQGWLITGNIQLPRNAQRMRTPMYGATTLVRTSSGLGWYVEATPPGTVLLANQGSTAGAITPACQQGDLRFTVTENTTFNAPADIPHEGFQWEVVLTQDATGGRTVTWNAIYKGVTLAASGTANQRARVLFVYDGSAFIQISSTGWYS